MKKYLITLIALLVFAVSTNAQKKKQFSWTPKYMTQVGLSADQITKVDAIKSSSTAEMQAVKNDAALAEDAKKNKLQDMQKKRLAAIDAVLTDEQKKKVEEIKASLKKETETAQ